MPKLEQEPRLRSVDADVIEWARRVTGALNPLADAIGTIRPGATPISDTLDGPAFSAYATAATTWTSGTVSGFLPLGVKEFDTNNCFPLASSVFTPTVAGYYQFNAQLMITGTGISQFYLYLSKNGTNLKRGSGAAAINTTFISDVISTLVFMNGTTDFIGLKAYAVCSSGNPAVYVAEAPIDSYFQGFLARRA